MAMASDSLQVDPSGSPGTRGGRGRGDEGAALVEFAIIMPLLFMLILGMFTGGLAYSQSISMNNAAREAARYGASLPQGGSADAWLRDVATAAREAATGDLATGVPGENICVAYVHPGATSGQQTTRRLVLQGASESFSNQTCRTDGRPPSERRVQVQVRRTTTLEALVFSRELTLERGAVMRYERA
jgi:Flp pilus assembly protein TadG